jgi:hypothetical protein
VETIEVHLACNDDRGAFAGELFQVQFHQPGGDVLATLELDPIEGLPFSWREGCEGAGSVLMIAGENFRVGDRARWVGNVCWDMARASKTQAMRLARHLLQNGFTVTQHVCEAPWDRLAA